MLWWRGDVAAGADDVDDLLLFFLLKGLDRTAHSSVVPGVDLGRALLPGAGRGMPRSLFRRRHEHFCHVSSGSRTNSCRIEAPGAVEVFPSREYSRSHFSLSVTTSPNNSSPTLSACTKPPSHARSLTRRRCSTSSTLKVSVMCQRLSEGQSRLSTAPCCPAGRWQTRGNCIQAKTRPSDTAAKSSPISRAN